MVDESGSSRTAFQRASTWVCVLLGVVLALTAAAANFSWTQSRHDSDSLLMAFISIDRLTPFYWGDNRYGMILPFLAGFITDYRWNLLFQTQLLAFAAVGLVVVFNVYFLHERTGWSVRNVSTAALALAMAILVIRPTDRAVQVHILAHPYHLSFLLVLLAVAIVLRIRSGPLAIRLAGAAALLVLSLYINSSNAPFAAGLFLLLPDRERSWRGTLVPRVAGAAIAGAAFALVRLYASRFPDLGGTRLVDPSEIPNSVLKLAVNTFAYILDPLRVAILLLLVVVFALFKWRSAVFDRVLTWNDGLVFLGLAVVFAISIASTDWVIRNLYEPRYWTVPVTVCLLVGVSWVAGRIYAWLEEMTETSAAAGAVSALFLAVIVMRIFGLPSPQRAMEALDEDTVARRAQIEQLGCTHMLGNYAVGWSSVFYAKSHGADKPRYAVTARSEVTQDLWSQTPASERKYCALCGDPLNLFYQIHFKLGNLQQTGNAGDVCRFEGK